MRWRWALDPKRDRTDTRDTEEKARRRHGRPEACCHKPRNHWAPGLEETRQVLP